MPPIKPGGAVRTVQQLDFGVSACYRDLKHEFERLVRGKADRTTMYSFAHSLTKKREELQLVLFLSCFVR